MYVDLKQEILPDGKIELSGPCVLCGIPYSVVVEPAALVSYKCGELAQDAFPDLSTEDREFLINGVSPIGWEELCPPGADEEVSAPSYGSGLFSLPPVISVSLFFPYVQYGVIVKHHVRAVPKANSEKVVRDPSPPR